MYKKSHWCALVASAAVSTVAHAGLAQAQQVFFDLPSQSARASLPEFGRQSGLQILAPERLTREVTTPAIHGQMDARRALARLLSGTNLSVSSDDGRTIVLKKRRIAMAQPARAELSPTQPAPVAVASAVEPEEAPAAGLAEIVVTAQRRGENLQDVPIAVNAISGDQLKSMGGRSSEDLNLVPGIVYNPAVGGGQITIRGISGTNSGADEPGNAIYVDGVYQFAPTAGLFQFNAIERVEVLKGPQGTLFGRNTAGGVVQAITRDPGRDAAAEAQVGYANYDTISGNLYLNAPLGDTLAANVAAYGFDQSKGWGKNVFNGHDAHKGYGYGVRSKLKWVAPSGNTDVVLWGLYTKDKPVASSAGNIALGALDPFARPSTGLYNLNSNIDQYRVARQYTFAGTIHQDLGFARLSSITAYSAVKTLVISDADGTEQPIQQASLGNEYKAFTQEFQLQSEQGSRLQWIVGAFYMAGRTSGVFDLGVVKIASKTRVDSYAAFGQATYPITDDTRITAGLRYTSDHRALISPLFHINNKTTDSKPSWRLALDHKFSEDVLGYISYSRGFKSGVFNATFPTSPRADPTKLDAYEVGLKTEALGHRLRINAAAFYYDYQDVQIQLYTSTGSYFANAGGARSYGLDLDVAAEPIPNLTLTGGLSLLNAKFTSQTLAPCYSLVPQPQVPPKGGVVRGACPLDGNSLQFSPKFTGSFAVNYKHETQIGRFDTAAAYSHNSGYFPDPGNFEVAHVKAFDTVNASLTWTSSSEHLNASIWAKNILDMHRGGSATLGAGPSGTTIFPMAPRTYGVTFGVKF